MLFNLRTRSLIKCLIKICSFIRQQGQFNVKSLLRTKYVRKVKFRARGPGSLTLNVVNSNALALATLLDIRQGFFSFALLNPELYKYTSFGRCIYQLSSRATRHRNRFSKISNFRHLRLFLKWSKITYFCKLRTKFVQNLPKNFFFLKILAVHTWFERHLQWLSTHSEPPVHTV